MGQRRTERRPPRRRSTGTRRTRGPIRSTVPKLPRTFPQLYMESYLKCAEYKYASVPNRRHVNQADKNDTLITDLYNLRGKQDIANPDLHDARQESRSGHDGYYCHCLSRRVAVSSGCLRTKRRVPRGPRMRAILHLRMRRYSCYHGLLPTNGVSADRALMVSGFLGVVWVKY